MSDLELHVRSQDLVVYECSFILLLSARLDTLKEIMNSFKKVIPEKTNLYNKK
jgi:hypothetical protein